MSALMIILGKVVLPAVTLILSILIPWGLAKLLKLVEKKAHISLSADKKAMLDKIAIDAMNYAEQQAANAVANKIGKMGPEDKIASATTWALQHLDELGVDDFAEDAIRDLIEAKVGASNFSG